MPDEREHRRRYGDKELGLILRRAAELQRQEPASAAEGGDLTLPIITSCYLLPRA